MRTVLLSLAILGLTASYSEAARSCKAPKRKKCSCYCVVLPCAPASAAATSPAPTATAYDDATTPPAPVAEKGK